jgi:hypothetical protein
MSKVSNMAVRATMCATCPFRKDSPLAYIAGDLAQSALTEASRICHSTGNNPVVKRVKVREKLCRGARNVQCEAFHAMGFIDAPTQEAFNKKRVELGMTPQRVED